MAALKWQKALLTVVANETHNTRRFFFKVPELERFEFKAGQFITFDLPVHEKKNRRWRSYSIASWPDSSNSFELAIVLLDGGLGSTYLFEKTEPGSALSYRGPQGVFLLPDE